MSILDITSTMEYSPLLKPLIVEGDDNILFVEFSNEQVMNYVDFINTGIIGSSFNPAIYSYMGHEYVKLYGEDVQFMRVKLEEEWILYHKKSLSTINTYMVIKNSYVQHPIQEYLEQYNYVMVEKALLHYNIYIVSSNIGPLINALREKKYIIGYKDNKYYINEPEQSSVFPKYSIVLVDSHLDIINSRDTYINGIIYKDNVYVTKKRDYEMKSKILWLEVNMLHYNRLEYMHYTHKIPHFNKWLEENDRSLLGLARRKESLLNPLSINMSLRTINDFGLKYEDESIQTILNLFVLLHGSGGKLDIHVNFPSYFLLKSLNVESNLIGIDTYSTIDEMLQEISY